MIIRKNQDGTMDLFKTPITEEFLRKIKINNNSLYKSLFDSYNTNVFKQGGILKF